MNKRLKQKHTGSNLETISNKSINKQASARRWHLNQLRNRSEDIPPETFCCPVFAAFAQCIYTAAAEYTLAQTQTTSLPGNAGSVCERVCGSTYV